MADEKVSWNNLESWQEVDEGRFGFGVSLQKTGLGLENQTRSFQFGEKGFRLIALGRILK